MQWLLPAAGAALVAILAGGFVIRASSTDADRSSKADECSWMLTMIHIEGAESVNGIGTLRWFEVEGGFWGIEADGGGRYRPSGLCDDLAEDGLRVNFEGQTRPGMASIHMRGIHTDLTLLKRA